MMVDLNPSSVKPEKDAHIERNLDEMLAFYKSHWSVGHERNSAYKDSVKKNIAKICALKMHPSVDILISSFIEDQHSLGERGHCTFPLAPYTSSGALYSSSVNHHTFSKVDHNAVVPPLEPSNSILTALETSFLLSLTSLLITRSLW